MCYNVGMKILSPAGNMQCLKAAVYNGADEVYLGINDFNARNNVDGFSIDTLQEAVDFAHIYDVRVYLAINILFSDKELQQALDIVVQAYNMGVDAFITQDLGLAKLIHDYYPEIELHASTQMGIHNLEGVQAIEQFGFKRVVLARETPLDEITRIRKNSNIEIEYFVQGALCVSFSGNCYLSSYLNDASGNRGKCKQLCRLPYALKINNKTLKQGYLLSAKDFCMIDRLDELKQAGVDSLKIEGRARRPYYVATTTRQYRQALDKLPYDDKQLQLAFNRDYTAGYFDGNGNIMSTYQNHIGINVGSIQNVNKGKKFNEVFFTSNIDLNPKSTFKTFANGKNKATLTAYDLQPVKGNLYRLTTTQPIDKGDQINLILDETQEQQALSITKKVPVKINITATINQPISATLSVQGFEVSIKGEICQPAQNQPLSKQDFEDNFSKTEFFAPDISFDNLDKVFLPKKQLNDFRRQAYDLIYQTITNSYKHNLSTISVKTPNKLVKFNNFEIVTDPNQDFVAGNIIYSPEVYNVQNVQQFVQKCVKLNKKPYLDAPNFALSHDIDLIKQIAESTNVGVVANNYYALSLSKNIVIGAGLNVYNHTTASIFDKPIITAESDISTKVDYPYMTLRHCPMKAHLNANCNNCPYKQGYTYTLDSGKVLKLKRKKLSTCTFYLVD